MEPLLWPRLYEISHEWAVGSANGTEYILTPYVDDGTHLANMTVSILIENRIPRQVWYEDLQTTTLTPLSLPTVFTDDDGTIVDTDWWFDENVNLDGGVVTLSSPFTENYTDVANPLVAWPRLVGRTSRSSQLTMRAMCPSPPCMSKF